MCKGQLKDGKKDWLYIKIKYVMLSYYFYFMYSNHINPQKSVNFCDLGKQKLVSFVHVNWCLLLLKWANF